MTILFEDVSKSYNGRKVINNLNFNIEDKKSYAFIGPEGCGKTTVLKLFMGLEKPDEGKISRLGDYKYPTLQSSYVSQEGHLNAKKTPLWNVVKAHRSVSKGRAAEELIKLLPEDAIGQKVQDLPISMQRAVEIVRALSIPSDFIVLDEPFAGMNSEQIKIALDYILNLQGSRPILIASRSDDNIEFAKRIPLL